MTIIELNLNNINNNSNDINVCSTCGYKIGKIPVCYNCDRKNYYKEYYKQNKQRFLDGSMKRYYNNKQECLQGMKRYAEKHKKRLKIYYHSYYMKNHDKMRTNGKIYYEANKKELNRRQRVRVMEMKESNPSLKLRDQLHSRMVAGIIHHKGTKQSSSLELLGVDNINIVREHLEKQFKPGMSWYNHGIIGWHIDHIIPCDNFDLSNKEEQKKCFHYTNLQPLWYKENLRKKNHLLEKPENIYMSSTTTS